MQISNNLFFMFRVLIHTMEPRECAKWLWSVPQEIVLLSSSLMLLVTTMELLLRMDKFQRLYFIHRNASFNHYLQIFSLYLVCICYVAYGIHMHFMITRAKTDLRQNVIHVTWKVKDTTGCSNVWKSLVRVLFKNISLSTLLQLDCIEICSDNIS